MSKSFYFVGSFVVQRKEGIIDKFKTLIGKLPKDETSQRTDAEGIILYKYSTQAKNIFRPVQIPVFGRMMFVLFDTTPQCCNQNAH